MILKIHNILNYYKIEEILSFYRKVSEIVFSINQIHLSYRNREIKDQTIHLQETLALARQVF